MRQIMAESFILNKVNSRTSLFAQKAVVVAFYTREASPIDRRWMGTFNSMLKVTAVVDI